VEAWFPDFLGMMELFEPGSTIHKRLIDHFADHRGTAFLQPDNLGKISPPIFSTDRTGEDSAFQSERCPRRACVLDPAGSEVGSKSVISN
jgi:hypothetical protein